MKKLISLLTALTVIASTSLSAMAADITVYAPDGRELTVSIEDVEAYKAVGWYDSKDDVTTTMYAHDGRELVVWINDVDAYKAVGWFDNKDDVTTTMYAPDGRELVVWLNDVDAYKAVGWYDNISDVTTILAAPDGRKITVYNQQVADYINVGWFMIQQDTIDPTKPMIALTFDDGPAQTCTDIILDTLELYNAKATFFVVGNRISGNESILQRMSTLGCQIGNHSYSHPNLATLTSAKISSQISSTDNGIFNAVGAYSTILRPPYGSVNSTVKTTVDKPMIIWSVDTLDWKYRDTSYVAKAATSNIKDGDIILMHDIHKSTAYAAKTIVPTLINQGFQLVTVDQLAQYKGYTMQNGATYNSFR